MSKGYGTRWSASESSTPNLDWVMLIHYHVESAREVRDQLIDCFRINRAFHGWGHQFLYNQAMLTNALQAAGFATVTYHRYGQSDIFEFQGVEGHEPSQDEPSLPHVLIAQASGLADPVELPLDLLQESRRDVAAR